MLQETGLVFPQKGKRRKKATSAEIAAAGLVINIYKLGEFLEELDMLESPMRTRKIPQKLSDLLDSEGEDELA